MFRGADGRPSGSTSRGSGCPADVMEITTREGYTYSIGKHIMPWFGPMRMNQIMPSRAREYALTIESLSWHVNWPYPGAISPAVAC